MPQRTEDSAKVPAPQSPGRFRRWFVRPLAWSLAAAVVLAAVLVAVLDSDWVGARARRLVESRLSAALDREVTVGGLEIEWLPFSVEAREVTIAGQAPGDLPFATAQRVVLEADPRRLLEPQPVLERLSIEGPWVRVVLEEDGSHNLPLPDRQGRRDPPRQVVIEHLEVADGEVVLDERRLPLALTARRVMARLAGDGPANWVGTAAAQEVEARVAELAPYLGGLALELRLGSRVLELLEARVRGPQLALSAAGEVRWGDAKQVALDLEVETSGALLADLEWGDWIEGSLHLTGRLGWTPEVWGLEGRLVSPALELDGRTISELTAGVALDERSLRLAPLAGTYHGGPLRGEVEVRLGETPSAAVRAELDGSRLAEVLADLGVEIEGLAGTVAGRIEYAFAAGSPTEGDGWADLELSSVEAPLARDLPVSGTAPFTIRGGVLDSRTLHLATPAAVFDGSGRYDLRDGSGRFDFAGRVEDAGRLLAALDPTQPAEEPLWRPSVGVGEVAGALTLASGSWRLRVEPELEGVIAPGYAADHLRGAVTLSSTAVEELDIELLRAAAALRVAGRVPFAESEALEVAIEATGWPAAEVQRWLPWPLPVAGPLTGAVTLDGSLAALAGTVDVALAPVEAFGVAADRLAARLDFGPDGARVERLSLAAPAGELLASGSLGAGEAAPLDFAVSSTALDLEREPFAGWVGGPLRGQVELAGTLGGTLIEPQLAATLVGSGLVLGERPLGEEGRARVALDWSRGEVRLDGDLLGLVAIGGGGRLDERGADLEFDLAVDDLAALARLATSSPLPAVSGRLRGELGVRGASGDASGWEVALTAGEVTLEMGERQVSLVEPARVEWAEAALRIESLYLGEPATGSEVFLFGDVPFDDAPLDLKVQVSLAGELAEPLLPGWQLGEGRLQGIGAIRGSLERPLASGQGEIALASVLIPGVPNALESPRGWLLFDPGRVTFDSVTARFGGGVLRAAGTLDLYGESGGAYELQVSAEDVAFRYPEGWWLQGDAQAVLASTPEGRRLRGTIGLERAYYVEDVPIGFAQLLQGFFARRPLAIEETDELLAATDLDLLVRGPGALRVRNNVAQLDGDIDLALRGSLARPVVFGTVDVRPGGTLVYADTEYVVERGELSFANPFRIEPVIDLAARAELRDYDVTLNLSGTLDRLDVAVASDPPLADVDVLTLLAGADVAPAEGGEAGSASGITAAGLLYGQAAAAVGRRVGRLFGLDKFRIDPLTGSRGDLSSARITVGERISRDLTATYSYDPASSDQQVLQLEWQVSRGLTLVATQNGDGSYAIDVRAEKSF